MHVAVLGLGLGYSLSCLLAGNGHKVTGIDINKSAFENPRVDEGMRHYISKHRKNIHKNVKFTSDYSKISDCDLIFIFVATPLINRRLSTEQVENAIESCLNYCKPNCHYVLLSTMPIGGCDKLFEKFPEIKKKLNYVPPMVRQGYFLETFRVPPSGWQMISNNADYTRILEVYKPILSPDITYIIEDYRIVEVAKLVVNAFLSNKIIFANAVDDFCRKLGIDGMKVMGIVGMDPRVGSQYIKPNGPVGGPCLPRDMVELLYASEGTQFSELLKTLKKLNDESKIRITHFK